MKRSIVATMVTTVLASSIVWAADNTPVAAQQQIQQAKQTQRTTVTERISEQGLYTMHDVQVACLALFRGDPEKAKKLTNEASALLLDDSTEWAKFAKSGGKTNVNDDQCTVIGTPVGISESYVVTPEKGVVIRTVNEKMAKGDKKGVTEGLCLANVDVVENQYLMSFKQTRNVLAGAQKLLDKKQYYEANLVSKGTEDGIIVDNEVLFMNQTWQVIYQGRGSNSPQSTIFYDYNTTGCGHKIIRRSRFYRLAFYLSQSKSQ